MWKGTKHENTSILGVCRILNIRGEEEQMGKVLNMNMHPKWVHFHAQHQGWERGAAEHKNTPMRVRSFCFSGGEEQPSMKNTPILAHFSCSDGGTVLESF